MKDVARDELLEEVVGAAVAEGLERAPEFRRGLQAPDAERCCLGTRLEDPRRRDLASPARDVRVVQRVHERRTRQSRAARAPPHGQFVAEPSRGGFAHAGDEQVLAQHRRQLDVEVVEGHDAIDSFGSRQVRGTLADVIERHVPTDVVERVDGVSRPVGVPELLLGQQQHPASLPPAFAQELITLPVSGDAEKGQGHGDSIVSWQLAVRSWRLAAGCWLVGGPGWSGFEGAAPILRRTNREERAASRESALIPCPCSVCDTLSASGGTKPSAVARVQSRIRASQSRFPPQTCSLRHSASSIHDPFRIDTSVPQPLG